MSNTANNISSATTATINAATSEINSSDISDSAIESAGKQAASEMPTVKEEAEIQPQKPEKGAVIDTINESDDLFTATESVAAMYGIPSSNIISDPSAENITVVRDNIVVPTGRRAKPSDNAKAIIQSVGAVMDYISQRVDDKLNQFQANNIQNGINKEKVEEIINPKMGKPISSHIDTNGDPIVVYDTGNVSMSNTKEAQNMVDELRAGGGIPEYKDQTGYSYFSDEDDIMKNIDTSPTTPDMKIPDTTGSTPDTSMAITDSNPGSDTINIPDEIGESSYLIDALSKYNNTRHLGYDIMQEQGFKFVKPCDFFMESAKKKKARNTTAMGIEHMKFDNTQLLKAIKLMNAARKEQAYAKRGRINIEALINSSGWHDAIDCLNKQFDARLNIRFIKTKDKSNGEFTAIYNDIKTHLTISKSKGFQLNGLPIDIFVLNTALDEDAPDDISLFGQHVISVLCHEIFHNIMAVLKSKESQFTASLAETMMIAKDLPSASNRRKLFCNFVNTINDFGGMKLNPITKRALVKHLTYLSTIGHDDQALREYEEAIRGKKIEGIDDQIKRMSKKVRKLKIHTYGPGRYFFPACLTVLNCIWLTHSSVVFVPAIFFGMSFVTLFGTAINHAIQVDTVNKMKNGTIRNYEEHWCDMFASCYNLPVTFFMVGKPRKGSPNDFAIEELKRYDELEREAMQLMMIKYPTISERNQSAVKYAKKVLESKAKIDPSIKKYMEWIVKNFSNTLDINLDETYSKGTFDPKTAEDLDRHIENLIGSANIQVTESYRAWLDSDLDYLD